MVAFLLSTFFWHGANSTTTFDLFPLRINPDRLVLSSSIEKKDDDKTDLLYF
jgi:hypothetical protein